MRRLTLILPLTALLLTLAAPAWAWTDYNTHDPGVTTFEALSYGISDGGSWAAAYTSWWSSWWWW